MPAGYNEWMNKKAETLHDRIYHIIPQADWAAAQAQGNYRPESLASAGFIHCSRPGQVERVANAFYRNQEDLLLLEIACDGLQADVRYEDLLGEGMTFPHIYGPLNLNAVVGVYAMKRDDSGDYILPEMEE